MTSKELKETVAESILNRNCYVRRVNDKIIRTRCPFCGDSRTSTNTGHFYIKIDVDDNLPMVFICFKCDERGILTKKVLDLLDIDTSNISSELSKFNKSADNFSAQ